MLSVVLAPAPALTIMATSSAATVPAKPRLINWAGYMWQVTNGGGVGDGLVKGNPHNVRVDSKGYLHLAITKSNTTWTGAELGTSKNLGPFGSFYWVISGPLTSLEPQDVIGAFTYGPAHHIGVDGTNEIDVEFSKWNVGASPNNADFTIYPATGQTHGSSADDNWNWTKSTVATCRVDWTPSGVTESVWPGVVAENAPAKTATVTWTYNGDAKTIPQAACPFLFNLWAFKALPTKTVDVVVRSFKYLPPSATTTTNFSK